MNKIDEIDNLIAQIPQTFARLTKDDRKTKAYLDIVEHGKIDGTGIDGMLATSVIEAGVSITDYPDNIVPIAVFLDNNIPVTPLDATVKSLSKVLFSVSKRILYLPSATVSNSSVSFMVRFPISI